MYIDGFALPVPRKNKAAYLRLARAAGKVYRDHGALEYRGCMGDNLDLGCGSRFPSLLKLRPGETALFSWVVYRSGGFGGRRRAPAAGRGTRRAPSGRHRPD